MDFSIRLKDLTKKKEKNWEDNITKFSHTIQLGLEPGTRRE